MKKLITALAILTALALAGCTPSQPDENTDARTNLRAHVIQLPDGRNITCVRSFGEGGGVTCDWAGAK